MEEKFIPYGKQKITEDDINSVVKVLRSEFITQGNKVPEFEQLICKTVDVKYSTAVNSATSALHLSCLALGLGKGDILWTSPITLLHPLIAEDIVELKLTLLILKRKMDLFQ